MEESFKSGFVAIIGRPNVGKSTLLNCLAKQKVAIISDKPQTTRHKIRAVVNRPGAQIVFIDTPGFHKPKDPLGKRLNEAVRSALREVDTVLFLVDASESIGKGDCYIARELSKLETPTTLVLNKIDKISQDHLEAQLEVARQLGDYQDIVPISSTKGKNVDKLLNEFLELLPVGPRYYPEGVITDQPEAVIIAEFIREKVLELTHEEVPHSVAVEVKEVASREDKEIIDVRAEVYVERDSQKGILIGRGGRMLKEIGRLARSDIENLLGSHVYLELYVKVRKNWRRDVRSLQELGYH